MQLSPCFPHLDLVYVILLHQLQGSNPFAVPLLDRDRKNPNSFCFLKTFETIFSFLHSYQKPLSLSLSLSLIGGSQTGFEDKILLHGNSMKMKLLREEDDIYGQPDEI
jgi:hypothetical protein